MRPSSGKLSAEDVSTKSCQEPVGEAVRKRATPRTFEKSKPGESNIEPKWIQACRRFECELRLDRPLAQRKLNSCEFSRGHA